MARLAGLSHNESAFLDTIGYSEGTLNLADNGYACLVGGGSFQSYAQHPRIAVQTKYGWTSAAGRYQIMDAVPGKVTIDTWSWASKACGARDFSPESQDRICLYLIKRRGALNDVNAGRFNQAISRCRMEWASLPGSPYGQLTNSLERLRAFYLTSGGQIS